MSGATTKARTAAKGLTAAPIQAFKTNARGATATYHGRVECARGNALATDVTWTAPVNYARPARRREGGDQVGQALPESLFA